MDEILTNFGTILSGFKVTLGLTAVGYVGALIIGTVVAVFRVGPIAPLRVIGTIYVEFFKNIPLLSLLILFVFGLPDIGLTYSLFVTVAAALALSAAAFVCEAMRAGINAVAVGQAEAARAIGLTFNQSLRFVILPQAFRAMVQPLVNTFIGVALGSSLASAVGVADLTYQTQYLNLKFAISSTFLVAGALYVLLALAGALAGGWIERKVAIRR
ncbi:MAG: amino acid ABC transporter permease [Mycobacteriaceae bacterium]